MYTTLISVFSVQQARKLLDETKMKIKDEVEQEDQSARGGFKLVELQCNCL
jgi:hypothetical protein